MDWRVAVDILSAALTPTIGITTAYIAYQQYRINQSRLRHELYERRLAIFKSVMKFIATTLRDGKTDYPTTLQFSADTAEADFLFDENVPRLIEPLYKNAIRLAFVQNQLAGAVLPDGPRAKAADEMQSLLTWFSAELEHSKNVFGRYLRLAQG